MRKPFLQPQQPTAKSNSLGVQREILTVSQLNQKAKTLIESAFSAVWLEGEVSNFIQAASGHWYFTLKDNSAQIKCALFKFKNKILKFSPKEGDKVIIKGKLSLYEARGDYQMIADYMEPAGLGNLQQQLNQLIKKLEARGLFSKDKKQQLPFLPKMIGVITSPTGAAIHDVITVLNRRCPMVPIVIYPTQVQGKMAASSVISALEKAQLRNECDVILMTRGGGSLEDLWCFNDEILAEKISECSIPIVAAIGHEVDVTITELVADLRAATPSAAAELIVPDQQILWQRLDIFNQDLVDAIQGKIHQLQTRLNIARLKIKDPEHALLQANHQLSNIKNKLRENLYQLINYKLTDLSKLSKELDKCHPKEKLIRNKHQLEILNSKLINAQNKLIQEKMNRLSVSANNLDTLSPLSTLARGYSIVRDEKNSTVITRANQVKHGQSLAIMLSDGEITCKVNEVIK